jgi:hypothetical protein
MVSQIEIGTNEHRTLNVQHRILYFGSREPFVERPVVSFCVERPVVSFCVERPFKIKNEQAFVAEIAMPAKSESILHPGCLQSACGGFTAQALAGGDKPRHYTQAGINPATTHRRG